MMTDKLRAAAKAAYDYITSEGKVYPAHLEQALEAALAESTVKESLTPQRPWVGLTDEDKTEIKKLVTYDQFETAGEYANRVQAATESKLKEKNT